MEVNAWHCDGNDNTKTDMSELGHTGGERQMGQAVLPLDVMDCHHRLWQLQLGPYCEE